MKETGEGDPSYQQLQVAYDALQVYLTKVNENKRTVDNLMDLIAIQDMIIDKELQLQAKGRHLVASKEFRKIFLDATGSPIKATIWLLSDMLLIGKKKDKDKYLFKAQLNTSTCVVWDLDPSGTGSLHFFKIYFVNYMLIILYSPS